VIPSGGYGRSYDGDIYVGKRMPDGSVVVSVGGSPYPSSYSGSSYYQSQPLREPVYGSRDFDVQYRNYIAQTDYLNSIYRSTGSYGVPMSSGPIYGSSRPVTTYVGPSYPVGPIGPVGGPGIPVGGRVIRR
jgi:hypothetical protein